MQKKEIKAGNRTFSVETNGEVNEKITLESEKDGISVYKVQFKFIEKPKYIGVTVRFPMINVLQFFSPVTEFKRNRMVWQWFKPSSVDSSFAKGMPSVSAIRDGKYNYITAGISDADHKCSAEFYVDDFFGNDEVAVRFWFFPEREISVYLRIDERDILLTQALKDQTKWYEIFYNKPDEYSEISEYPLYSSWYNFHQNPTADKLLEELKLAHDIGFKSVILDDGWQFNGKGKSVYDECGDWKFSEEKFPDPKGFVDKVHEIGMKIALWFPVPFVGNKTKDYERFKDKFLYTDEYEAGVLDIRYKECREYVKQNVKKLMEYGFDGMKLDFIDSFVLKKDSPKYNAEMDYDDLTEAVVKLVSDIHDLIKSIKSDSVIEFRQDYIGPSITRFSNMLRVADCAFDSITNRIGIVDLRMLNYKLAVHSDMLFFAKAEKDENVARQLINILFGVPQISVMLKDASKSHLLLLKKYIEYWEKNKNILLHGDFETEGVDCTYTMVSAKGKEKDIVALYLKEIYKYNGKRVDLFNGTNYEKIYIDTGDFKVLAKVYDCHGNLITEKELSGGICDLNVPLGGMIKL